MDVRVVSHGRIVCPLAEVFQGVNVTRGGSVRRWKGSGLRKVVTPLGRSKPTPLRSRGHDYLKQMCQDIGYAVVPDIESLPSRITTLYRQLTA